jgi:hypothetical protein
MKYLCDLAWFTLAAVAYAGACWLNPFRPCRWCKDGRGRRACRWCDGTGRRLRWGRRFYNAVQRVRAAAR